MPVPVKLQRSATTYADRNNEYENDNRYQEKCAEYVHGVLSGLMIDLHGNGV
jgi:hypothetical protein